MGFLHLLLIIEIDTPYVKYIYIYIGTNFLSHAHVSLVQCYRAVFGYDRRSRTVGPGGNKQQKYRCNCPVRLPMAMILIMSRFNVVFPTK